MNIKLPGSLRVKKIILIVLVIISICVLSYEFIQNKNNKVNRNSNQEEILKADEYNKYEVYQKH